MTPKTVNTFTLQTFMEGYTCIAEKSLTTMVASILIKQQI